MENYTQVTPFKRSPHDYLTTKAIAGLLKSNLGINARMASVSKRSSLQYVTISIRDAKVDHAKVKAFAATLDSWTMDQSECCAGQSVSVVTSKEVDAVHAAPFIEEIKQAIVTIEARGSWMILSTGAHLNVSHQGFWVTQGHDRGCYIWPSDVRAGKDWAICALALQMARLGNVQKSDDETKVGG